MMRGDYSALKSAANLRAASILNAFLYFCDGSGTVKDRFRNTTVFPKAMKKTHLVLLIVLAAAVAVIFSRFSDFSTYETFASAAQEPQKAIKVVGVLDRSQPVVHDPKKDTEKYSFHVTDKKGATHEVIYVGSKSLYDIEKSENIVMTGKMDGQVFRCSDVQLKCPSKYKDKEQLAQQS
jgi:cytochrome c-type biogenesis protein CcmE